MKGQKTFISSAKAAGLKNNSSKDIGFASSFLSIYKFSRLFGLMPFTVTFDAKGNVNHPHIKLFDILWLTLCLYSCMMMAFTYYENFKLPQAQKISSILVFGNAFLIIFGVLWVIIIIIMDLMNRFKLIALLKMFNSFDKEVSAFIAYEFSESRFSKQK